MDISELNKRLQMLNIASSTPKDIANGKIQEYLFNANYPNIHIANNSNNPQQYMQNTIQQNNNPQQHYMQNMIQRQYFTMPNATRSINDTAKDQINTRLSNIDMIGKTTNYDWQKVNKQYIDSRLLPKTSY